LIPQGTLPEIARWLGSLADGLDGLPEEIAGRAAATLRRGADRFAGLVPANA